MDGTSGATKMDSVRVFSTVFQGYVLVKLGLNIYLHTSRIDDGLDRLAALFICEAFHKEGVSKPFEQTLW